MENYSQLSNPFTLKGRASLTRGSAQGQTAITTHTPALKGQSALTKGNALVITGHHPAYPRPEEAGFVRIRKILPFQGKLQTLRLSVRRPLACAVDIALSGQSGKLQIYTPKKSILEKAFNGEL